MLRALIAKTQYLAYRDVCSESSYIASHAGSLLYCTLRHYDKTWVGLKLCIVPVYRRPTSRHGETHAGLYNLASYCNNLNTRFIAISVASAALSPRQCAGGLQHVTASMLVTCGLYNLVCYRIT